MAPNFDESGDDTIQLSRDRFECFECGFASSDREEFDKFGLAMTCPECQSLRVEHVFTGDDNEDDLVADGGLPTCEDCGETFSHETTAGPGQSTRSCGCDAVLFEVDDDTDNGLANAAIRALNAAGDVETAAEIYEATRGRLVADGGMPDSFDDLASTCESCGEDVEPERLIEGECPGCHYHEPVADGGTAWTDLTGFKRDILEAIRRLDNDGETTYGLAIKDELERVYTGEIHHGRLYPNLNDLVDAGLVEKSELDNRTNQYELTSESEAMLEQRARLLADACGMEQPVADGGDGQ